MLDVQQSYEKIISRYPLSRVSKCLDFGNFFVFFIRPFEIPIKKQYFSGTVFPAVNKKTGAIYNYDITDNVALYERAKSIDVEQIWDLKIEKGDINDMLAASKSK